LLWKGSENVAITKEDMMAENDYLELTSIEINNQLEELGRK